VACGTPAAAPAPAREQRKTLTILFCDVAGSTALGEQLDPEALRRVMRRYFDEMTAVIERHGGTVEKFIGDAVMAVFGVPVVREDDALRAVRAAAEIRERLPTVAQELGVTLTFRTGVNTGEVVVGAGQTLATGDAMNVAARLEQAAPPGEIYIGADTRRLVRDAVEVEPVEPLELKGKADPVAAFRLVSVDFAADALARRLDAPLVGRDRELELLRGTYDRAVREGSSQLFTLLGSAGAGKSRLTAELIAGIGGEATVVRGRCLHYGDGVTFWPLVEILMQLGEPAAPVLDRISEGAAGVAEELFWDVRRLFEQIAAERPLVAVFDDLHWAEPMLLDMLDHIADLSRGVPILLLCIARPELLDERAGWGGGKVNATTLLLEPLGEDECEALLAGLGDGLDPGTSKRIVRACGGNPLFLEEMVALVRDGGDDNKLPPTIRALLDARLERLGEEERSVIERGAVEGEVFHHRAIRALVDDPGGVDQKLAALVRKEMIRPERAQVPGDDAFRFRHLLIRDAAYEALPKQARADLHERFAGWLEQDGAALVELDEIAGWHLEQAVRYRRELGIDVDPQLASRAADHLGAGGRRAVDRRDLRAANALLSRALDLLDAADARRPPLLFDLVSVLVELGELQRAETLLADAPDSPRRLLARYQLLMKTNPNEMMRIADEELPGLIAELKASGDDATLAKAYLALLDAHWMRSQALAASKAREAAIYHAQRAGDTAVVTDARLMGSGQVIFGPASRDAVQRWIDEAERDVDDLPLSVARIALARLHAALMDGDFAEARRQLAIEDGAFVAVGFEVVHSATGQFAALIEMAAGDAEAAERFARESWEYGGQLGDTSFRPTTGGHLARALAALGRYDEALAIADEVDTMSADDDVINFVMTRGVRAEAAAAQGDTERAGRLAREGIEFALRTDFPIFQGFAYEVLYKVEPENTDARERMLECFRIKGYQPGLQAYS
jgi:class 3 adenylate cyclase/tetratricopeptide (TPR) repeat protein